jgi:signal transduction histidine kinase/ligand-binding sensor domain-containing protein/CheY-like chemotaxis protein
MVKFIQNHFVIVLLLLSWFSYSESFVLSQETAIKFSNFFEAENFNNGSIVCIFQDKEGFLWFGTYGGLYRYDGHIFKEFLPVINNSNSLINSHVRSICQDSTGAIFIGTFDGLCIYYPETDNFKRFVHDPTDSNSLINNTIYKLLIDQSGTIWVATWGGGLDKIEKTTVTNKKKELVESYRFVHHLHEEGKNSISSNIITDLAESPDGNIWLATQQGLDKYDKKKDQFYGYYHDPHDPNSLSNSNIAAVCVDQSGNVWAGSWENGLNLLNPVTNEITRFMHSSNDENCPGNNIIMRLYCDLSGTVWVGTWGGGLDKIKVEEETLTTENAKKKYNYHFIHYKSDKSNPFSITGNSIYSILEDKTGSFWIGTDWNGLNKFNREQDMFRNITAIPGEPNSLVNNIVFTFCKDSRQILWIGTQNGINTYDRRTGKFTLYQNDPSDPNSLSHNEVRSIIEDKNGNIWAGTIHGLNKFDRKNNQFERYYKNPESPGLTHIVNMYEDKKGYLWLATYAEGLLRFDPRNKSFKEFIHQENNPESISSNIVWAIAEDKNNTLWIGTENGGLCEYNANTETFYTYWHNPNVPNSISHSTIYSLKIDFFGNLWIGTINGLDKLVVDSTGKKSFVRYAENHVNGIAEDNFHELWMLTDLGLGKFNKADSSIRFYETTNSRQIQLFSINAIMIDTLLNEVYIGGLNGYHIFYPEIIGEKPDPPITKIVNLKIFNKTINVGEKVNNRIILPRSINSMQKLVFSYKEYVISIEYAALHYQSPRKNQFAYMLEGFDKDWNFVENQQVATYTNLPPGTYTFKVKAATPSGVWNNEPTAIGIVIRPAWWNTLLFKILLALTIVFIAFYTNRFRINLLKERQRALEDMVSKRTEELSYANTLLTEKQEEISTQNEELRKHRNELKSLVAERTQELTIAKDKAEESDRLKSAFLANMSHEIRTPMNAIVGFSGLQDDETLDSEEKRSYISTIKNNSDTLLTIINDILDISMIEANQLVLYKERFCVDELLAELKVFYDLKNDKKLNIECCNQNTRSKTYLYSDPIRLRQVLMNLLNNAFKFTETGSIKFGYKIEEKAIRFFVEDTGIGITESNKMRIFDDFHKIEPDENRFHQGTGIGLSISKKLVHQMEGEIFVESEINKGSVFSFTLPSTSTPMDQSEVKPENHNEINLEKTTIVVAEDEPDNYLLIEKLLKKTGSSLIWAQNGKEAVDYLQHNSHDNCLVLMDIKMPVMNGIEACSIIKEMNNKIPVIAVTAFAQAGDKEAIMKNSFDDFISKPLNFEKLWQSIARHHPNKQAW